MAVAMNVTNEILDIFCQLENLSTNFNFTQLESFLNTYWSKIGDYLDFKPDILRRIARRCGLPPSLIVLCVNWLCDNLERPDNDLAAKTISQVIRYAVKKLYDEHQCDAETGFQEQIFNLIVSAYRKLNDPEIKSQLTWALGYLIPNNCSAYQLPPSIFASTNSISENAKEFLFDQIRQKNSKRTSIDPICDSGLPNFGTIEFAHNAKLQSGVYVTQTQSAVSIKSNHFESEKTKVLLLNLFETFKSNKDRLKAASRFKKTDQLPKGETYKAGSDLYWYQDTYMKVEKLLNMAKSGDVTLRDDDVNIYLEGRLLAYHFWTFSWGGKSTEKLNVDISEIVLIFSKNHCLKDNLIDKLLMCLSPTLSSFSRENLSKLRYNAIRALYNCSLIKNDIFSRHQRRLNVILKCGKFAKNDNIKEVAIKILAHSTSDSLCDLDLFEMVLECLEKEIDTDDVDNHLHIIMKHTWDPLKSDELFQPAVKTKLVDIITSNRFSLSKRRGCADIIHSYLSFSSSIGILDFDQFKRLLKVIEEPNLSMTIFPSIILGLEKGCRRSAFSSDNLSNIVDLLFLHIKELSRVKQDTVYYAIIALAKVVEQNNVSVRIECFDGYLIENFFFDETRVVETNCGIEFVCPEDKSCDQIQVAENNGKRNLNCNEDLNRYTAISFYVADIYLKSLRKSESYHLEEPCLEKLLKCLEQNPDKQTRICLAEILYCKRKHFNTNGNIITTETVARLANFVKDPVVDVRMFSASVYVYFLSIAYAEAICMDEDMDPIADLFVYDQLTLGDNNFTDDINSCIMTIFLNAVKNDQTLPDKVFEIFNYILMVDENYVDFVLELLDTIVSDKKLIPKQTMCALENVLYRGKCKFIFEKCIENGEEVTEKIIDLLVDDLYCHNKDVRVRAFMLLDKADANQDLGDPAFGVLEMERVGRVDGLSFSTVSSFKYLLKCVDSGKLLTPYNFEAFGEIIGTDDDEQTTILITRILNVVISEQRKSIPDILLSKLNSVITTTSHKVLISSFCQLVSHVLNNNQIISESKMIMSKLENFLELQLSDEEFSDILHAIVAIAKTECSDQVIELSDGIILKLLQRMQSDKLCRKNFAKFLPKIIKCTQSPDVIKNAKIIFTLYISSSEYNLAFHSVNGFLEMSKSCASNLDSKDLSILLKSCDKSDDEKCKKIVLEIVNRYDLTSEQIVERDDITANRTVEYYFERLSACEDQDDLDGVQKYLSCVKDIFASDNTVLIGKAILLLKLLSLNKDMIHLITSDILSALIGIEQLNADNSDDLLLSMYQIVKETVELQEEDKIFFLSTAEIEKLCEFAKGGKRYRKFFQNLLDTILKKYTLPSHDQQKIEITNFFGNADLTSFESINTIQQKVLGGTSLDFDQIKSVIENFHTMLKQTTILYNAMVGRLLIFTDLISMLLIQGKVNLVELQLDSVDRKLMEIIEYVIKHRSKVPVGKSAIIKSFEIVLKHAAGLDGYNMNPYFDLIPSILEFEEMNKLQFKIASAQYILTCIECLNHDEFIVNSYPTTMITWLENGLNDSENLVRTGSFDSLRKLHLAGNSSEIFRKWSLNILKSITKKAGIPLSQELSEPNLDILHTCCLARFFSFTILQNKNLSPSSIRYEILCNDIFQRYLSTSNDLILFSENFATLLSTDFYSNNLDLFCNVLETLILAVDQGHIISSDLGNIIVFLKYVDFETFSTLIRTPRQSLFNDIRRESIFVMLNNKLDDTLKNGETVNGLVQGIEANIDFQDLCRLLSYIETIDSVDTMHSICQFFSENRLNINDLSLYTCKDTSQMLALLQVHYLTRSMSPENTKLEAKTLLRQLFDREFSFHQLEPLFHSFNNSNEQAVFIISKSVKSILTLFVQFRMDPKQSQAVACINRITDFMKEKVINFSDWFTTANAIIVEYIFKNDTDDTTVKSLARVLAEFQQENGGYDTEIIAKLRTNVDNIINQNKCRVLFTDGVENLGSHQLRCHVLNIDKWEKKDFQTWAEEVKTFPNYFQNKKFIEEALAVLMKANSKCYHYELRNTQILSCLVAMMSRDPGRGLLQQIVTGGGKSTIIRLLAILLALKGCRVFVVTSSSVLAERDARDSRQLFEMFNLTVDHNRDQQNYISGPKSCYAKDVVFGAASQFQFDILRDEYSCLSTLSGKKLDVVIVDEVDNMFIDDSSKFTRLSSTLPGMDQLQLIYHFVWSKLNELQSRIFRIENRTFLAMGKLELVDGILSLAIADDVGNIVRIDNFRDYIERGKDTNGLCIVIEDVTEGIYNHLKNCLLALLTNQTVKGYEIIPENKMLVPKHLKSFVESQISRWVDNALTALQYMENVHYVVDKDDIKPVDFDTTGIIQSSTSWSDGLHQFLQIKHNLPMTSENLATNYLSTLGFFKRFKSENIYGFTGTFGSEAAKKHTEQLYSVDLIKVPNSSIKLCFHYEDLVLSTKTEWISAIVQSTEYETKKNRACLIICRTIREAEYIYQKISEKAVRTNSVKLYTSNLTNEEKCVEKIGAGEVIVATNLAGRGTDIKTEKTVEVSGGLHVCMTFLPPSQRAEDQAIGRTSRLNNVGTSQFILHGSDVCNKNLREKRDIEEEKYLSEFRDNFLNTILTKDELFEKFCSLLNFVRTKLKLQASTTAKLASFFGRNISTVYETNMLSSVEERWALFIRKVESMLTEVESDQVMEEYEKFDREIRSIFEGDPKEYINIIGSPFYAICIGNYYIHNGKNEEALKYFDHAIKLDESFSAAAFVGKSWCLVSPECRFLFFNASYETDYKIEAIKALERAFKLLETERAYLATSHSFSSINKETGLSKQLLQKLSILGNYINSVEMAIITVRASQRLIDISYRKVSQDEREDHYGKLREKLHDKYNKKEYLVDVTFNDLTIRHDCKTIDQAINVIASADLVCKSNMKFQIHVAGTESDNVLAYFSPDIKHRLISKKEALELFRVDESASTVAKFKAKAYNLLSKTSSEKVSSKLTIYRHNATIDHFDAVTETEAIKKLQSCHDSLDTFDIKLYGVNDTKIFKNSKFELSLLKISAENAKEIFKTINTDDSKNAKLSIKIFGKTKDLIEFCRNLQLLNVKFRIHISKEDNVRLSKFITIDRLESINDEYCCIELFKFDLKLLTDDCLMKFSIDILCKSLDLATVVQLLKIHKGGRIDLAINANKECAKTLIPSLRDAKFKFALKFLNLSYCDANKLIEIDISEEDIIVDNKLTKQLPSLFLNEHVPKEIVELMSRGLEYLLVFQERKFVPWYSIASVCALGVIQLIVGGLLIATVLGAPIGMALCTEGSVDLMFALRTYQTRNFTWKDYGIQKSVSMLISISSLGLGAFKNAGQGIVSFMQGLQTEAAEQGVVQCILNGKSIFNVVAESASSLKVLALKQVGVSVAEAAARETLFQLSSNATNYLFNHFENTIEESVSRTLKIAVSESSLLKLLNRLDVYEKHLKKGNLKKHVVSQYLDDIINPDDKTWKEHLNSISVMICLGVASTSHSLNNPVALGARLFTLLWGAVEIKNMENDLCQRLKEKLLKYEQREFSLIRVIEQFCDLNREDANIFVNLIKRRCDIDTLHDLFFEHNISLIGDLEISEFRDMQCFGDDGLVASFAKEKLVSGCNAIRESLNLISDPFDRHSEIIQEIVNAVTHQIVEVSHNQLITPSSSLAIGHLVRKVSTYVQANFIVSQDQNSSTQNKDELKYDSLMNQFIKGQTISEDEMKFLNNYKDERANMTIARQISYNATDFQNAKQFVDVSRSLEYSIGKTDKVVTEEQINYAKSVESNGKKAGLLEIKHLSEVNNCRLVITGDENEVKDLSNKFKDHHVLVYDQKQKSQSFLKLFDSNGTLIKISVNGSEDTGYKMLEHLTGQKETELRKRMANDILNDENMGTKIKAEFFRQKYEQNTSIVANSLFSTIQKFKQSLPSLITNTRRHFESFTVQAVNSDKFTPNSIGQTQRRYRSKAVLGFATITIVIIIIIYFGVSCFLIAEFQSPLKSIETI